jgi:hypothetical protein
MYRVSIYRYARSKKKLAHVTAFFGFLDYPVDIEIAPSVFSLCHLRLSYGYEREGNKVLMQSVHTDL